MIFAERNWHDFASHRPGRVRSDRFKYIRNDDNDQPLTPPADAVRSPTFVAMRRLRDGGKLTPLQGSCFVSPRPVEELYDVDADSDETVNLSHNPKFVEVLATMRKALSDWERETKDVMPEKLSPDENSTGETGDPLPNRESVRGQRNRRIGEK